MNPDFPSPPRPSGFTLIELLTVIAIIGILAAILIPVVGKVRDSAKNTVFQSNLREWHSAWVMYGNDHGGRVPRAQQKSVDNRNVSWTQLLGFYADYDSDKSHWFDQPPGTIGDCPADPHVEHGPTYISYAMNVEVFGVDWTTADPGASSQINMETLGDYPNTIIIGDRARNWHMTRTSIREFAEETFRHNHRANYVNVGGAIYSADQYNENDPPIRMWDPWDPAGYYE